MADSRAKRSTASLASRSTDWLLDEIERAIDTINPIVTGRLSVEIKRIHGGEYGWGEGYGYYAVAKQSSMYTLVGDSQSSRRRALANLLSLLRHDAKKQCIKIPRRRNA